MQQQLGQANQDVKKTNDRIEALQKEESRVLEELEGMMKKAAADANLRLQEAVQKQNGLDVEALSFASEENERLKQELSLAIKEKNKVLTVAEDARIAAGADAKRIKELSSELSSLKELLRAANISCTVAKKLSDSNVEMESSKSDELLALSSSTIDPQMLTLQKKSKDVVAELVAKAPSMEILELELRNAKECESQAMGFLSESKIRIEMLEMELGKAKESEAKMLESLISQTKQFEETKISLEEAKLEIASLYGSIGSLSKGSRVLDRSHHCPKCPKRSELDETVKTLKNELKFATEAEENSRNAMDGLAFALKEVTTEANQVKEKFASAQSELEDARMEASSLQLRLKSTEDKFQVLLHEARREIDCYKEAVERLKKEADESTTSWNVRECGLLNYIKKSEEEIASTKEENRKLVDSLRKAEEETKMARAEIRNLRDIVKQAVTEARVAKGAAEIARPENSRLIDNLSDMSGTLESITKENERLKIKENPILENFKAMTCLNASASTTTSSKTVSLSDPKGVDTEREACKKAKSVAKENKGRIRFTLEESMKQESLQLENVYNRHNDASLNSNSLEGLTSDNMSERKGHTLVLTDDDEIIKWDDLDHNIEGGQIDDFEYDGSSLTRQRKKKALLKRFRTFLRRKSC